MKNCENVSLKTLYIYIHTCNIASRSVSYSRAVDNVSLPTTEYSLKKSSTVDGRKFQIGVPIDSSEDISSLIRNLLIINWIKEILKRRNTFYIYSHLILLKYNVVSSVPGTLCIQV